MSKEAAEIQALIGCITRRLKKMDARKLNIAFHFVRGLTDKEHSA